MSKNKNEVAEKENNNIQVTPGFDSLDNFNLALKTANLLSKSSLVPKNYQGNIPNCVIAINMAQRMQADPLMVMQNLYIVHGKPGWSAQFLISTFNTSGRFSAIRYNWVGEKGEDSWGCQAWALEKETGDKLEGATVTIKLAKDEGWYSKTDKYGNEISKWQTMPEQMLMYRAAAWFIRTYAPEIAMGMYTEDEIIDVTPDQKESAHDINVEQEISENANTEKLDIDPSELNPDDNSDEEKEAKNPEKIKENKETKEEKNSQGKLEFEIEDE